MELSLAQIAEAAEARWITDAAPLDRVVGGWSIDSRTVKSGDLFVAIKGEHFDGHRFVWDSFRAGATAALVMERVENPGGPLLLVDDTIGALQRIARRTRENWKKPLIAVTGSAGKTSTKDIIAALLSPRFAVGKTTGNLNNHIGLPLTLLRLPANADMAVVEMGMNHAGEIRTLAAIAQPQIGIVTNVGYAHIEAFASIEAIAAAKRELIESLAPDGIAVLNADDPRVLGFRNYHKGRVLTFGFSADADLQATDVSIETDSSSFSVFGARFKTRLTGRHAVSNILGALAVASLFEIPIEQLINAVAELAPGKMRGERLQLRGATILNDSYNSNPEAVRSMIDVLIKESARRKIAVLGEMLELGEWAEPLHREVGRYATECGIDALIGVQGASEWMIEESVKAGLNPERALFFDDSEGAGVFLRGFVQPGDAILFKGSRGTHVERALAKMEE